MKDVSVSRWLEGVTWLSAPRLRIPERELSAQIPWLSTQCHSAAMTTVDIVASHILKHLPNHAKPLFVAVQGPQGSGKTYLSAQLRNYLTSHPHNLRAALLSIDDLYLPHSKLVELAQSQPPNPLWQGRGPPGTHDVELGVGVLSSLKDGVQDVEIPRFDKSLHDGQGDRLPMDGSGVVIKQPPPMDVVILEGWCVGFHPITQSELENRWDGIWKEEREKLGLPGGSLCSRNDVERINKALISYGQLWNFFDVFIEVGVPLDLTTPFNQHPFSL